MRTQLHPQRHPAKRDLIVLTELQSEPAVARAAWKTHATLMKAPFLFESGRNMLHNDAKGCLREQMQQVILRRRVL